MKIKLFAAAIALPLLFAGTTFAAQIDGTTSSTNLYYTVNDGVATVYGNVESAIEKTMIEKDLVKLDGVDDVRSLIIVSD